MQLKILLDLTNERMQRQLLAGLDSWVQLGLLSDRQVREIAAVLSQPLPEASDQAVSGQDDARLSVSSVSGTYVADSDVGHMEPALVGQSAEAAADSLTAPRPQKVSWIAQAIASLVEEISVIWLLFLGVFLVVVSSGVLAASQWDSFSAVGQYGVLFAYTLAFWAASIWAQKRENLQSTGRMLALTTMLLIPVNFWVMDRFGVLGSPLGVVIAFVAAIALTIFPLGLSAELMPRRTNRLNLIGLSWLHWGWGWAIWPVIATYVGTVSTAANLTAQDYKQENLEQESLKQEDPAQEDPAQSRQQNALAAEDSAEDATESLTENSAQGLSFDVLTVALSVLILLVRSLWIAQVAPSKLGLAAGICGWLLVWLTRYKDSRVIWERAGFGLLLLGWIVSVAQVPPLQAIAISVLAISLLWYRLRQTWHQLYLLALLGVGLQAYGLIWSVVPTTLRDRLLSWLSVWFDVGTVAKVNWAGIGLFPYVLGLLAFAVYLRRRQQRSLSQLSELLALALGFGLALMSAGNPFTTAVNLSLSVLTLIGVLWKRQLQPDNLVTLTHGVGLLSIVSWIHYFAPELSTANWASVFLGGAIAWYALHLTLRQVHLQLNAWWGALALSAISYGLLIQTYDQHPRWLWLAVPVMLTVVANHRRALYPQIAAGITMGALALQLPWVETWPMAIVSSAVATLCMGLNSQILRSRYTAFFTVGTGLLLVGSAAWYSLIEPLKNSAGRLLIFWVIAVWSLWLIQRGLMRRSNEMALIYVRATRIWAALLMVAYLFWATCLAVAISLDSSTIVVETSVESLYGSYALAATVLLMAALAEFIRYRPIEWRYWSLAWATEVAVVMGLTLQGVALHTVGIATLALALVLEIAADLWVLKHPPYRDSWHNIPLVLAGLGFLLGHVEFQADTCFFTLATGLLLVGIGRRQRELKFFSLAGLAAFSVGTYELLIYQLSQASGGRPGDGITLLAGLALVITVLYRGSRRWLPGYLKISPKAVSLAGHLHWVGGSLLCVFATLEGVSQPRGIAIWTLCSLLLAGYALSVGNRRWTPDPYVLDHSAWTWIGLTGALLCVAYDRYVWFPDRSGLFTWGGAIACVIGAAFYYAPWERWGWSEPWRLMGLWLPMLTLSITMGSWRTPGLLLVATFYAWMAKQCDRIRLSYLSILLLDLSLLDYLDRFSWLTSTTFSLVCGLSLLYVAEVEPYFNNSAFNNSAKRQQKHWLRILASGLVGLSALYQTEVSRPLLLFAAIAVFLGIAFVFAGLILKVRAFLYVGTATFIAQILRVLWLFISANSLLLWAVGIVLGLVFIWVAATFESRRSQLSTQLSSWTSALESWD